MSLIILLNTLLIFQLIQWNFKAFSMKLDWLLSHWWQFKTGIYLICWSSAHSTNVIIGVIKMQFFFVVFVMQTQIISYLNIHCQNWEQMAAIDFPSHGVLSWGFEYEEIRIMCIQLLRQLRIHSIWKEIIKKNSESGKIVACINNFSILNWQYKKFYAILFFHTSLLLYWRQACAFYCSNISFLYFFLQWF